MLDIQSYLVSNNCHHTILLLQHPPTFTVGRRQSNSQDDTVQEEKRLGKLGAEFIYSKRGGEITFHGPGQLVGYPILNLKKLPNPMGIREYVDAIQDTILKTCALDFNLEEARLTQDTGVWIGNERKIAAIGVQVQRYITSHGFALNCNTDLTWFDNIIPCGLEGKTATSLTKETGRVIQVEEVVPKLLERLSSKFQMPVIDLEDCDPNLSKLLDEMNRNGSIPKNNL